nr:N-acetyltransferase [Polymorphobacter arshaanensis]
MLLLRPETPSDIRTIAAMTAAAFGDTSEVILVERLRAAGNVCAAIVAEEDGELVGHVLLSVMSAPFMALALAPLAVHPLCERRGIGAALVRAAIAAATEFGATAIFVLGDPDYYTRFGFSAALADGFSSRYAGENFMVLPLSGALPVTTGEVRHAAAFWGLD